MIKSSKYLRKDFIKYKKHFFILIGALMVFTYPLYLFSHYLNAHANIEMHVHSAHEVTVDYNLDFELFDNSNNVSAENKLSDTVIKHIKNAKHEIIVVMYSFNIESIRDELKNAADRGVKVTIYFPYDRQDDFNVFIEPVKDSINVEYVAKYDTKQDYYNMHHKYVIVDPGTENQVLLTGPWNWSHFQQDLDMNFILEIKDTEIIESFLVESKRISRGFSGYNKFRDLLYLPWEKKINYANGDWLEIWFSPGRIGNSVESRTLDLLRNANDSIIVSQTMIFSESIVDELVYKAKKGVNVDLMVSKSMYYAENSFMPWLEKKINNGEIPNMNIHIAGSLPTPEKPDYSIFHHHNVVIDDTYVIISTANWSFSGFYYNDENTFIIKSGKIAKEFKQLYENNLSNIKIGVFD